jgi:hypothetical protein
MTYINRLINLVILVGLVIGSASMAMACGCAGSADLTMSSDSTYVYANGTYDFAFRCLGDIYLTVTAPDSTYVSSDGGEGNSPLAYTLGKSYGTLGGTYNATANFYWDGTDAGLGEGYLDPQYANYLVCVATISPANRTFACSNPPSVLFQITTSPGASCPITSASVACYPISSLITGNTPTITTCTGTASLGGFNGTAAWNIPDSGAGVHYQPTISINYHTYANNLYLESSQKCQ